jgi:hypothetical protein
MLIRMNTDDLDTPLGPEARADDLTIIIVGDMVFLAPKKPSPGEPRGAAPALPGRGILATLQRKLRSWAASAACPGVVSARMMSCLGFRP